MKEYELVVSPLCQTITRDGITIQVEIYSSGRNDWILEVVDEQNTSIVWDGTFNTDRLALEELHRTLDKEGIQSIVGAEH